MTTYEILQKLEWQESELGPRCPLCRAYQPRGHREGCEMQAALDRELTRGMETPILLAEVAVDAARPMKRRPPLDPGRAVAYAVGVAHASVCAPSSMTLEEILRQVDAAHPTGLDHGWSKSEESFSGGEPNPCACHDSPGRLHFLLSC